MCKLCDAGHPQDHSTDNAVPADENGASRRDFLTAAGVAGAAAGAMALFGSQAHAQGSGPPGGTGGDCRRYIIKGGAVLSMDPAVGDFDRADVLVDGKRIAAVGPDLDAAGADVIGADGMIVMPGFVDTHHHQFETALRSFLADGLLFNDGQPHGKVNYFDVRSASRASNSRVTLRPVPRYPANSPFSSSTGLPLIDHHWFLPCLST